MFEYRTVNHGFSEIFPFFADSKYEPVMSCWETTTLKGQVWNAAINKRKTGLMVKLRLVKRHFSFGCRGEREKARLTTTCETWPFTATPAINLPNWGQGQLKGYRVAKLKGWHFQQSLQILHRCLIYSLFSFCWEVYPYVTTLKTLEVSSWKNL